MTKNYRVAVIAGDGIGREVVPEGIVVLEAAARCYGFGLEWREFDWSCRESLCENRPHDAGRRARPVAALQLGISRRGRVSRRTGPRFIVGIADPAAPQLPAI